MQRAKGGIVAINITYSVVTVALQYSYITHTDYTKYINAFNHNHNACSICLMIVIMYYVWMDSCILKVFGRLHVDVTKFYFIAIINLSRK